MTVMNMYLPVIELLLLQQLGEPESDQKDKTRKVKPIWIYWSKRQWVAMASAEPYANLHLDHTDNHSIIPPRNFLQAGCPSCHPANSIKALKAHCQ